MLTDVGAAVVVGVSDVGLTLVCEVGSTVEDDFFFFGVDVHPATTNTDKINAIPSFFIAKPLYSNSKAPVYNW